MDRRSVIVGCMIVALAGWAAPGGAADFAAGQAKAALCADCHGSDGVAPMAGVPHLAGQNAQYLAKQLRDFREPMRPFRGDFPGVRKQALMSHQAAGLGAADIDDITAWFASRPCAQPSAAKPAAMPTAVKQVCANCHGETGRANSPLVPHLSGQKADYLIEQMKLYRASGAGKGESYAGPKREHPLMDAYANRYDDAEFRAVAIWYAAQACR